MIYNPRKGEIVRYYGSYKESEGSVHTYLFPALSLASKLAFLLVCCVFFDVIYLANERTALELSWAELCCSRRSRGCDFHDTGALIFRMRAAARTLNEKSEKRFKLLRTHPRVDCTSKCRAPRTLYRRFNVCMLYINVYGVIIRVHVWVKYCTIVCSVSLSRFFFCFYSQGGGWPLLPKKKGGSVLRRLHYFLLLSSIL